MRGVATVAICVVLAVAGLFGSPRGGLGPSAEAGRPSSPRAQRPVPVVLVVLDELPLASLLDRDRQIDPGLFPNFSRLASTSTWYRNATTVAEFTRGALPALLTGLEPEQALLSLTGQQPQSIFTLLHATHDVRTSRAFPNLCALSICSPTPRLEDGPGGFLRAAGREPRGASVAAFMDGLAPETKPCLCVVHMVFPHSPWRYLPTGQQYPDVEPMPGQVEIPGPGRKWRAHTWLVKQARQRHLLQVAFTDRLLGHLVGKLRRAELFEEALMVVAADHGIAFDAGLPKRTATQATGGDIAWVPLFVKMPYQHAPHVIDAPVETIDVVPTVVDALEVTGAIPMDGIPLHRARRRAEYFRVLGSVALGDASELASAVEKKLQVFPRANHWLDLFRLVPRGSRRWLGRRVVGAAFDPAVAARVAGLSRLRSAPSSQARVPSLVKGRLDGADPSRTDTLAIALDGRVVAVTKTYTRRGTERFYALIPPTAYSSPPREVQLFRIHEGRAALEVEIGG